MEVTQRKILVGDLYEGYTNSVVDGVYGYNSRLEIRPEYQREFIYKGERRNEVIRTVLKGFPLNIMYWARKDGAEDEYELLDGQQRTISICDYIDGAFSVDEMYFSNLKKDIQQKILDYELDVYVCTGVSSEKIDWFEIVNIGGLELKHQEILNAVYAGTWTVSARSYFSREGEGAYKLARRYLKGDYDRQDYLETALKWITKRDETTIENYMGIHQYDRTAIDLWNYFRSVIEWVEAIFPEYRKEMKGIEWGYLYNTHGDRTDLDPAALENQISELMQDDEVTSKKGIYEYVLTGDYKKLNLRTFDDKMKREAYELQDGICPQCGKHFEYEEMDGDHIIPWSQGGKTTPENCQMLCRSCNRSNSTY